MPWNFLRTITECHEISLELLRSAAKFCSNLHRLQRNMVVAQTIGLAKYRWKIAPNKISLIIIEYSRISPNYVCITFAQYCIWRVPHTSCDTKLVSNKMATQIICWFDYSFLYSRSSLFTIEHSSYRCSRLLWSIYWSSFVVVHSTECLLVWNQPDFPTP